MTLEIIFEIPTSLRIGNEVPDLLRPITGTYEGDILQANNDQIPNTEKSNGAIFRIDDAVLRVERESLPFSPIPFRVCFELLSPRQPAP